MKTGVKITNANYRQEGLDLKPGTHTYTATVRPVTSTLTFRVGNSYFYIPDLIPNQLTDVSFTFDLPYAATTFYPSVTINDEVFDPQLEEGTNSSTRQPNPDDSEDMMEEVGLRITADQALLYATKNELSSQVNAMAGAIDISVGNLRAEMLSAINVRAEGIELTVSNLSSSLAATGINLTDKKITITSDNTIFQSNNGALNALFSSNYSKIKSNLIELEGIITANQNFKVLADGSIEAVNGKFTGTIDASTGRIAGFYVAGQSLSNRDSQGNFYSDATIVFRNDLKNTFAAIGGNVLPSSTGLRALARLQNNEVNPYTPNYALIVEAANGSENHAISMLSGFISGLAIRARRVSTSTYLTHADVYVSCYNTSSISIYLPSNPVIGKILFVRRVNTAAITLNGNGKIIHWGAGSGSTKSAGEGIGDTAVLIYDGQYWMYNYWIRS